MPITIATESDIPELVKLINSAYRGEISQKGWTSEAHLLKGELRTDEQNLLSMMKAPAALFLKFTHEDKGIDGCVYLQENASRLYLGMLSVSPFKQARGIGRQLMNEAWSYAKLKKCRSIYMRVISLRTELIDWYKRQGFAPNGEMEEFPPGTRFGTPSQPLEFLILEKQVDY